MLRKVMFLLALGMLLSVPMQSIAQPAAPTATVPAAAPAAPAAPAASAAAPVATPAPASQPVDVKVAAKVNKADEVPLPAVNPDDPGAMLKFILQAIKEARWAWLVGLVFMLLTFLFNKILKDRIPKKVLPWIAIGLGVATNVAMSFASGMHWLEAIGNGITLGLAAAGGWSAIGKSILGGKKEEAKTT